MRLHARHQVRAHQAVARRPASCPPGGGHQLAALATPVTTTGLRLARAAMDRRNSLAGRNRDQDKWVRCSGHGRTEGVGA